MVKSIWLVSGCVLLASCGGDKSSGAVVVSPSPTPAATTPSSPLSTGEVKPASNAAYIAAAMEMTTTGGVAQTNGVITGGSTSDRSTTLDPAGFSANYSAGYRLADASVRSISGRAS
jgi:hypothetical protein